MNAFDSAFPQPSVPTDLIARIGEAVASTAVQMQQHGPDAWSLQQLETLGLQLQESARVLSAPGGARPEMVDLGRAALQARAEWAEAFHRAGASWAGPEHGCQVSTNPAVLKLLLDMMLAHALGVGQHITVDVMVDGAPRRALLRVIVANPGAELFAARPGDVSELHWQLLAQLARHGGVEIERHVQISSVSLSLRFEPLGITDARPLGGPATVPYSVIPAGCRVLLLEPHEMTRLHAERLMLGAGLLVRAVPNIDEARQVMRQPLPDCLVTGLATRLPACAAFVEEVRAEKPGLRIVELSEDPHVFDISLPGSGAPARVARADIGRSLVTALAQELSVSA